MDTKQECNTIVYSVLDKLVIGRNGVVVKMDDFLITAYLEMCLIPHMPMIFFNLYLKKNMFYFFLHLFDLFHVQSSIPITLQGVFYTLHFREV